jgi:Zn-dependent metalloprotease
MLEEIAKSGTARQQQKARQNLAQAEAIRSQRLALPRGVQIDQSSEMHRVVYDARNGTSLPGQQARAEGAPATGDAAVDEAYDGAGATYKLYQEVYERNSIDGNGLWIKSTVHYDNSYDNAFWNGQQMVYGDGDEDLPVAERLFNRFTIAIDVIGHELTHGVTQYEAQLTYANQPGALNESMSDVFGSLVKQRTLNHTAAQADWIIGQGLFTANINGVGIRSMKAPGTAYDDPVLGKDPQPAHMNDYKNVDYDNGGVHINSGIPNHAFYATAKELGGFAWEKAGRIWYVTLADKLSSSSDFQQAANLTFQVAGELYGANSLEQQAVRNGWAAVGITVAATGGGGGTGCLLAPLGLFGFLFKR